MRNFVILPDVISLILTPATIVAAFVFIGKTLTKHLLDKDIVCYKAALASENESLHANLEKSLESYKAEIMILNSKLLTQAESRHQAYKEVTECISILLSDLDNTDTWTPELQKEFNRKWFIAFTQLALYAPIDVMNALEKVEDYVMGVVNWQKKYNWDEFHPIWQKFIDEMRNDLSLNREPLGLSLPADNQTLTDMAHIPQ